MLKKSLIAVNILLLLGCNTTFLGTYGEQHQTLEAFAQRVESVFKFQNSMTNAVMLIETEPSAAILEAEQKMQFSCESLNQYAVRESDGLSIDLNLKRQVEKSAISCEKAAIELQHLLFPVR